MTGNACNAGRLLNLAKADEVKKKMVVKITCKDPDILWERISELNGNIKIIGVRYKGEKLVGVEFEAER